MRVTLLVVEFVCHDVSNHHVIPARSWPRSIATLTAGAVAGCALGVIARVWMRVISDDPEFTWNGTIFIVAGFTIFGLGQSIAAVARRRNSRRWRLTIARLVAAVTMLPLFFAAGSIMFPTVVGGALARFRTSWPAIARVVCVMVATIPVVVVGRQIVDAFGWSLHSLFGFVMMLAVYMTIIAATRFVVAAQLDGWRLGRGARIAAPIALVASTGIVVLASSGVG